MPNAIFCTDTARNAVAQCWRISSEVRDQTWWGWLGANADKLVSVLISAILSAGVTFIVLRLNRVRENAIRAETLRRELRKVSMDTYKEFFSEDLAASRYAAEQMLERHGDRDWTRDDPYDLPDPDGLKTGYAAVTRFWSRLAILYQEEELDREFTEKLLSRMAGYWWGLVYERMTQRPKMFTGPSIRKLCDALRTGSRSDEFEAGYRSGVARRDEHAQKLAAVGEIEETLGVAPVVKPSPGQVDGSAP